MNEWQSLDQTSSRSWTSCFSDGTGWLSELVDISSYLLSAVFCHQLVFPMCDYAPRVAHRREGATGEVSFGFRRWIAHVVWCRRLDRCARHGCKGCICRRVRKSNDFEITAHSPSTLYGVTFRRTVSLIINLVSKAISGKARY